MTTQHFNDVQRMHETAEFMKHLGGVRTEADTRSYLERNVAHWERYGFGMWILRDPATSELLGRGGLRHLEVDGVDEVEIGYGFFPRFCGRGLATEMARACVFIAREKLGLETVVADATPDNAASMRVMVKAGFAYERKINSNGVPLLLFRASTRPFAERR